MMATQMHGVGDLAFVADPSWLSPPDHLQLGKCSDVATDDQDRVWIGSRGDHPVTVWDSSGQLVGSWSEPDIAEIHGIHVAPSGRVWTTDLQLHVVREHNTDGSLVTDLGVRGRSQPTITHRGAFGGKPFNMPASIAVDVDGRIFVADGYGNRRIHRFDREGTLEISWGRSGDQPGEFSIVHHVSIDTSTGTILVSDRDNDRLQFFDPDGDCLEIWDHVRRPTAAISQGELVYVLEMGIGAHAGSRGMSVFARDGSPLGRWYLERAGSPLAPHGLALDSRGDLYVADVTGRKVVKLFRK